MTRLSAQLVIIAKSNIKKLCSINKKHFIIFAFLLAGIITHQHLLGESQQVQAFHATGSNIQQVASFENRYQQLQEKLAQRKKEYAEMTAAVKQRTSPSLTPIPTVQPTPTPINTPPATPASKPSQSTFEQQLLESLNTYRAKHGKPALAHHHKLADFSKTRTETFIRISGLDSHAGFNDYIYNQNGFSQLGFRRLGENSSYGYRVSALELIENVYGKSSGHNQNQLGGWTHVGISAQGTATNFVFGGN